MREFFDVCFLTSVQMASQILIGIGSAFTTAGHILAVYFSRYAERSDAKFAKSEKKSVVVKSDEVAVDDGWSN